MRQTSLLVAGAVCALLAGSLLMLWGLTGGEPPETSATAVDTGVDPSEPEEPVRATVSGVVGRVERRDPKNKWLPVRDGDELVSLQPLRTGPKSTADVRVGSTSSIRVAAESEFAIAELTRQASRIELRKGRLSVRHRGAEGQQLQVDGREGQSVIASRSADFEVQRGTKSFAVAARTGTVDLLAAGKRVQVDAGKMGTATGDNADATVRDIPAKLLLKIARATRLTPHRKLCAVVEGKASVGSRISVGRLLHEVDDSGRFRLTIPRPTGRKSVVLTITDILGRSRHEAVACAKVGRSKRGLSSVEDLNMQWGDDGAATTP